MQKRMTSPKIMKHLQMLLKTFPKDYISETEFRKKFEKTLMYPTDDVLLYKDQFDSLISVALKSDKEIFLLAEDYEGSFDNGELFVLSDLSDYEEYAKLNLSTLNVLFSSSEDWIVLIEESLEGGIAVLAGSHDFVRQFKSIYLKGESDFRNYVRFCIKEYQTRKVPLTQLTEIINLMD